MDQSDVRPGRRVLVTNLHGGFVYVYRHVDQKSLANRRHGATGVLVAPVPNTGGEVWFVRYHGTTLAAHALEELVAANASPTFRDWTRTPEQAQARTEAEAHEERLAARREEYARNAARREAAREAEARATEEELLARAAQAAEEERLVARAERLAEQAREAQERLDALRQGRRRSVPRPASEAPSLPKYTPGEEPERFLDI